MLLLLAVTAGACVLGATGCAAAFREPKSEVTFTSMPKGASVAIKGRPAGATPTTAEIPRAGSSDVTISAPGYDAHRGSVRKSLNGAWVTVDVLTCVFPVALCIPLLVDALTGAWVDVDPAYDVTLRPESKPAEVPMPTRPDGSPPDVAPPNGAPILPGPVPTGTGPEISL